VRPGETVEFARESDASLYLHRGDLGRVEAFTADGRIVVSWSTGFVEEIDPTQESFLPVATRYTPR